MICQACGCKQGAGQFCRQCGAPLTAAPPAPGGMPQQAWPGSPYAAAWALQRKERVQGNVQPMGILWLVYGLSRLLSGFVGATVLRNLATGGRFGDAPPFLPHLFACLAPIVAVTSAVMGCCALLTGYALLTRKSWGRTVALVFAILALLKLPFGTALGIYTIWVLAPRASWAEWDAISRAA